jgi:hypothetical protein
MPVSSPGICRLSCVDLLEAVELLVDRGLWEPLLGLYPVGAQGEDRSFGPFDHRFAAVFAREHLLLNLVGRVQQLALVWIVANDPCVVACVAGGRHPAGEWFDRVGSVDLVKLGVFA